MRKLYIKKLLIAGGNSTALVYNCPVKKRKSIVEQLLGEVEQVGFVSTKGTFPKLQMMGGELCINGTLAFASTLDKKGKLVTSSITDPICYFNLQNTTTIKVPLNFEKKGNIILFHGIGYILFSKKTKSVVGKNELSEFCRKYNLPAFGGIIYENNKITPYVFVKSVNSFVRETACGSGSIAFSILSGIKDVVQPTGEIISVEINKLFETSAKVVRV